MFGGGGGGQLGMNPKINCFLWMASLMVVMVCLVLYCLNLLVMFDLLCQALPSKR